MNFAFLNAVLLLSVLFNVGCGSAESDSKSLAPHYGTTFRFKAASSETLRYEKGVVNTFLRSILINHGQTRVINTPEENRFFEIYEQFDKNCRLDFKVIYNRQTERHVYFNFDTYVLHKDQDFQLDPSPYEFRSLRHAFPLGVKPLDWRSPEGDLYESVTLSFQSSLRSMMMSRDVKRNCDIAS